MIFYDIQALAISASPSGLKDTVDHLNWLAKGSTNKESSVFFSQTRQPVSLLNSCQHVINRIA